MSRTWSQGEVIAFMVARCNDCVNKPVKHGRWKGAGMGDYMCSWCATVVSGNRYRYCPNCGSKMDGGENG